MSLAEATIKYHQVLRPFEARVISDELRARVEKFQKLLKEKRVKSKKVNVWRQ
jgi:hypothetical protein